MPDDVASPILLPEGADACWEALLARDRRAEGRFVYAVRTTGVYCRPGCASRLPRRENVSFHPSGAAAAAAGFRPCLRCRPDEPDAGSGRREAVARACRLIDEAETLPTLAALAQAAGLSAFHFHRVFREVTGVTPNAYARARRAARVSESLQSAGSVTEAIYEAGYNAPSRFYAEAEDRLGMAPGAYRRGGAGWRIRYGVETCSLGSILVATTERGICAILLGDDPALVAADFRARFPAAELLDGDAAFREWMTRAIALVEAPGTRHDLPLDIAGTAFQQRVWEALRAIPAGTTATYTDVARAIGAPSASRAVALACGANPVAVAVPCHRVVRADGSLSGYRWGIARKRTLLDREAAG
jgi:AraC family transcriptional regulator of adaptative response/methylated-DNA-[protein]-cysteine methyltransferase